MKNLLYSISLSALLVSTAVAQVPGYVPTTGLAAWYSFNGNANDLSGNANNPTNTGVTFVADRNGNPSAAANFNGTSSVLTLNTPSFTFSETGGFTYSVWLKKQTQTSAGVVLMSGNSTAGNFISNIQGQSVEQFGVNKQQSSWVWASCAHTLNVWDHYVAVYDAGAMSWYKNGALQTSTTFTNTGSTSLNLPFYIGRGLPGGANYYLGAMDDIGIWTRALTQQEITDLYNSIPTGITNLAMDQRFSVYPNPANDLITISTTVSKAGTEYTITDQSGRQVLTGKLNEESTKVDISQLSTGVYFFQAGESAKQSFSVLRK